MKLLWIVNIPLPEVNKILQKPVVPYGGWLVSGMNSLLSLFPNIEMTVAFPQHKGTKVEKIQGSKCMYYSFPLLRNCEKSVDAYEDILQRVVSQSQPDIVHIHGTEYPYAYALYNVCKKEGISTVVSIQGLVTIYAKHYTTTLPQELLDSTYPYRESLLRIQDNFLEQSKTEKKLLTCSKHIIGRTTWDKATTFQMNRSRVYHHCNELLRESFYDKEWQNDRCIPFSIFLSQGAYPIKGFHTVLEALPLIIAIYPKAKVYVAGANILDSKENHTKSVNYAYAHYIDSLISKYKLQNSVEFVGLLDEESMAERYLQSNVFVCPSVIENSPNSLSEAMILGLPCVASYVGGIPDMLQHEKEGYLYQQDAPYMLAHYICEIFKDKKRASQLGINARNRALTRHSRKQNTENLMNIYSSILLNK